MAEKSTIQWTDATWNPVRGCTKVSPGCTRCYAETFAERWRGIPGHPYEQGFDLRLVPEKLGDPLRWRKPRMVFVNSMSDLFHKDVSDIYIDRVFAVMAIAKAHTFQVLTKRAERMRDYLATPLRLEHIYDQWAEFSGAPREAAAWPLPNVWAGVSVEDQKRKARIDCLYETPAAVRFVSFEPLLEDLGRLDLLGLNTGNPAQCICGHGHGFTRCPNTDGIAPKCHHADCHCTGFRRRSGSWTGVDWAIVGGESGAGARPFDIAWAGSIRDQCKAAGVAYFFKQAGSNPIAQHRTCSQCEQTWVQGDGSDECHKCGQRGGPGLLRLDLIDRKGGDLSEIPGGPWPREFPKVG